MCVFVEPSRFLISLANRTMLAFSHESLSLVGQSQHPHLCPVRKRSWALRYALRSLQVGFPRSGSTCVSSINCDVQSLHSFSSSASGTSFSGIFRPYHFRRLFAWSSMLASQRDCLRNTQASSVRFECCSVDFPEESSLFVLHLSGSSTGYFCPRLPSCFLHARSINPSHSSFSAAASL